MMNLPEQPAKPISFSSAMVEAIQSGRKSQTRRLIKNELDDRGLRYCHPKTGWEDWHGRPVVCPFGRRPGNLLWVREEHLITTDGWFWYCEFKDGHVITTATSSIPPETLKRLKARKTLGKWQRARFLPRYFARNYLRVADIRVERLQDISAEDAIAEGIEPLLASRAQLGQQSQLYLDYSKPADLFNDGLRPTESFRTLWEKINGPKSWNVNPWVWVVMFEKASTM